MRIEELGALIDLSPELIPLQTVAESELPADVAVTGGGGSGFVGSLNAQTGNVVIAPGSSGFTFPGGAGTITMVSPLTTKGDLYTHDASNGSRLAVAANDARLTTDSTQTTGLRWVAASTGWGAASGTLSRAAYAAYAGQTVSNPPTQAEMQALDDAVKLLSQTVAALITDLTTQKVIKP